MNLHDTVEDDAQDDEYLRDEAVVEVCYDAASVGLTTVHYLYLVIDAEDCR